MTPGVPQHGPDDSQVGSLQDVQVGELEDLYVAVPVELHAELVGGEDATARSAPGVRVDVGAAVEAIRVVLEVGGGLTTVIVGAPQLKAFSARLGRALRRRGVEQVSIGVGGVATHDQAGSMVDVSDEQLYRELLKRLAATAESVPPTDGEDRADGDGASQDGAGEDDSDEDGAR
jgi:hypothetical protein